MVRKSGALPLEMGRAMRPRFQFRLRTMMIGVTLVTVVCGYFRWRYDFVWQRKAMIHRIETEDGQIEIGYDPVIKPLPWVQRILGDSRVTDIYLPAETPASKLAAIHALFPDARLWRHDLRNTYVQFPDYLNPDPFEVRVREQ
jgi:hypothetical protein